MVKTKDFLYRVFCGFFLGLSVFAPGFSGSIIAIAMGIYQDIIRIAANPFKKLKENIIFCIPLAIGVVISAILFIIGFKYLFDNFEKATYLLFVGLITGNIPLIYTEIKKHEFKKTFVFGGICAFVAALTLAILATGVSAGVGVEVVTAGLVILALSGLAGGATALVPGMSVSMILILMGVYYQLIYMASSLLHFEFTYLVPFGIFGLCAVLGLVLASNVIKYVFDKIPGLANTMVFGFMLGSLIGIFYQSMKIEDVNFNWLIGAVMLAVGLGISMLFVVVGKVMDNKEKETVE